MVFCRFFRKAGNGVPMPLAAAHVAQLAERVLGKDEVTSSNLVMGSIMKFSDENKNRTA